jgi:hypothetical protein
VSYIDFNVVASVGFEVLTAASMNMAVFWLNQPYPLHCLSCMSFPPPGQAVACPLSPVGPGVSLDLILFPTGPAKVVFALAYWFLYIKLIPRARLTHRPDDGGSKDL